MRKKLLAGISLLIALILGGCASQTQAFEITETKGVNANLVLAIDQSLIPKLEQNGITLDENGNSTFFEKITKPFVDNGFAFEPAKSDSQFGFRLTKSYPTIQSFNEDFAKMKKSGTIGTEILIEEVQNGNQRGYRASGKLSFISNPEFDNLIQSLKGTELEIDPDKLATIFKIKIVGNLIDTNMQLESENIYFISTNYSEPGKDFSIIVAEKGLNIMVYAVIGTFAVLVIGGLSFMLLPKIKRAKKIAKEKAVSFKNEEDLEYEEEYETE